MLADYKLNLLSIMGYNGLRHNTDRTEFVTIVQTPPTKQTLCPLGLGSALQKFRLFWVHSMLALSLLWVCFESTNADWVHVHSWDLIYTLNHEVYLTLFWFTTLSPTSCYIQSSGNDFVLVSSDWRHVPVHLSNNSWCTFIGLTCNSTRFQHVLVKLLSIW